MARLKIEKLPVCSMARVILHWTAGTYKASALDQEHYHFLVEGDGTVVYGTHDIDANAKPAREPRASHTRNCNTGSIGVSICSMKDAKERPFSAGAFPMTVEQWKVAAEVVAELCRQYSIDVTPRTVLAHGEVQETLKIEQLQKWDPLVQPWSPSTPRTQVMDGFRALVKEHLTRLQAPPAPAVPVVIGPSGFKLQSQKWKGKRAVLLVHGVGNAKPGDYTEVAKAIQEAAGEDCAVYSLFYDIFNDWIGEKIQAKDLIGKLIGQMKQEENGTLPEGVSEFAGDVLWPMFSLGGRTAVRTAYIAQLHQMVIDGLESLKARQGQASTADLNMSIVCHSLGCFHTYEVLHTIATDPMQKLSPATDGIKFNSVVFMASPVQLIRTLGERIATLLPAGLKSTQGHALSIPSETALNDRIKSVGRWVSVTGDLDPIGGHFMRRKAAWAFMTVPEQEPPIIDKQTLFGSDKDESKLALLLKSALSNQGPPSLRLNNPHSWLGYIERHKQEVTTWLA